MSNFNAFDILKINFLTNYVSLVNIINIQLIIVKWQRDSLAAIASGLISSFSFAAVTRVGCVLPFLYDIIMAAIFFFSALPQRNLINL